MPKLTSGLTQKERIELLHSIDLTKLAKNSHEQKILQLYRNVIARECSRIGVHTPG
jgi:deoxyribose-phosphate aldolase